MSIDSKKWSVSQLNRNVFRVTIQAKKNEDGEYWFLLTSDRHWDNPDSNHELQIKHMKLAIERGAGIIDAGDFFCLMQGKFDKRASKSKVRPEHQKDNYLDEIIKTSTDFFKPYAKNFILIATGNHEQSISDRYETNMIERFCGSINTACGSTIQNGGFSGWVIFQFLEAFENSKPITTRTVLHYDHGYGGGGPVTADMIQHQRRSVYLPDADIIMSGHTHDKWVREIARVRLTHDGTIRHDIQTHIKIPTYKDEYKDGYSGWHSTKGLPPKPIGAYWLRFYYQNSVKRFVYDVIEAK